MFSLLVLSTALAADPTPANQWPGFRGDGSNRTGAADLPLTWSPKENIAWRIPLPGYGQSSPVVWGNLIVVTAVEGQDKETCLVLAIDSRTGKDAWKYTFKASQTGKNNPSQSRAAPTAVIDGTCVCAFFEGGDLVGLGHDGKVKWERSLVKDYGAFKNHHGLGSSLAQTEKAVVVLVDHGGPSYLLAVDKRTGKTLWKTDRKGGLSWTSPVVAKQGDRSIVLVSSNGTLSGYDAEDGKELWTLDGLSGNLIPSPTVAGDLVFVGAGESGLTFDMKAAAKSNCLVRLTAKGDVPSAEKLWEGKKVVLHHASPLVHDGHVYLTTKNGILHCLDLKTGEEKYAERLPGLCWATPIAAGDRVYFFGKDGVTTVVKSGGSFETLATNRLWGKDDFADRLKTAKTRPENQYPPLPPKGKEAMEAMLADAVGDVVYGAAVVNGTLFIRTGTELICVRVKR